MDVLAPLRVISSEYEWARSARVMSLQNGWARSARVITSEYGWASARVSGPVRYIDHIVPQQLHHPITKTLLHHNFADPCFTCAHFRVPLADPKCPKSLFCRFLDAWPRGGFAIFRDFFKSHISLKPSSLQLPQIAHTFPMEHHSGVRSSDLAVISESRGRPNEN